MGFIKHCQELDESAPVLYREGASICPVHPAEAHPEWSTTLYCVDSLSLPASNTTQIIRVTKGSLVRTVNGNHPTTLTEGEMIVVQPHQEFDVTGEGALINVESYPGVRIEHMGNKKRAEAL